MYKNSCLFLQSTKCAFSHSSCQCVRTVCATNYYTNIRVEFNGKFVSDRNLIAFVSDENAFEESVAPKLPMSKNLLFLHEKFLALLIDLNCIDLNEVIYIYELRCLKLLIMTDSRRELKL